MTALHFVGIILAQFTYAGGRALMQLTVVHHLYKAVPACSLVIAIAEVVVIGNIAVQAVAGTWLALVLTVAAMTVGGSSGAAFSMWLHKRLREGRST